MHPLLFFFLLVGCWAEIKVSIDEKGGYKIIANDKIWLRSSYAALYTDNKWYSSEDNSLPLTSITTAQGNDPYLGNWNETQLNYDLARNGTHTKIVASIRQWQDISAITFHFSTGDQTLTNTVPLDRDQVRTVFPSFNIEQLDKDDQRSYFTFEGIMTGDGGKHAGTWDMLSRVVHSGLESGPLVIFNQTQRGEGDILVLSPLSRFMATSIAQTKNILEYGVVGSMFSITPNYNHSLIVFYSSKGINEGIREWGQVMQRAYNRTDEYRINDLSINNLGYYTDNGAYYYYHTEDGMNYEQTMLDALHQISLPFHYLQIDSWWYYKGIGDGVTEWVARPDIFPDGLPAFSRKVNNIPIVAHNRYWAYDTIYKMNYSFILDEKNGKALPVGNDSFWIDLFTQGRQWGLIVYEQDWLITQTEQFSPVHTDLHLGHQWLKSMGEAADKLNINLQYCMSLPRHILTALQIPRVTHTRTSTDYAFHIKGLAEQWAIGISSMFADAIGLAPFKDVFWSSSLEPGAPYKPSPKEVLPEREAIIATLSTGPIGPGDAINYTNVKLIMQCCRSDGLILKPDRPLTTINRLVSDWALSSSVSQGELYSTRTTINNQIFHIVFASSMKRDYLIYPSMIGAQSGVIWPYGTSNHPSIFDDSNPLHVSASQCHKLAVCLWYVSPVWQLNDINKTRYALLGELNKWTAVSQQRFLSIVQDDQKNQITITVQGLLNENITLSFLRFDQTLQQVTCRASSIKGQVDFVLSSNNIACSYSTSLLKTFKKTAMKNRDQSRL